MKQNKKTALAELSYYGLYLLDYLRKYHPDKVSGKSSVSSPLKPSDSAPLKHSTMPP